MENLIDLIHNEFMIAQYEEIGQRILKHLAYNDFWVTVSLEGEYELDKLQEDIFACLEGVRKDFPSSEKSTSLLIIQRVGSNAEKNPHRVIEDENNVYYFKKYVIQYTEVEWNEVKTLIYEGRSLGELLMETEVFEQVKQNVNSANRLLYTVAHKLPFIMMRAERKPYNPNPNITVGAELQHLLERIDEFRDMQGRNATEDELIEASAFIDQWINEGNNE